MEYHLLVKSNKLLIRPTIWMNLKKLSERSQTEKSILCSSIYTKFLKVPINLQWQKADQQLPGDGAGGRDYEGAQRNPWG